MTSYVHVRPVQVLRFEKYPGLEVRCKSGSVRQYLAVHAVSQAAPNEINPGDAAGMDAVVKLAESFADILLGWNLTEQAGDSGEPEPVPATLDGMLSMHYPLMRDIVEGWLSAVAGIPDPLDVTSPSGDIQPGGYIPTEPLSESLAS